MKTTVVICTLLIVCQLICVAKARVQRQSTAECDYIKTKLTYGSSPIDPAKVPSVSPVCVQAANNLLVAGMNASLAVAHGICITQCQSLYELIKNCFGKSSADFHFDLYCGVINGTDCLTVRQSSTYTQLASIVSANCGPNNTTPSCTNNCTTALQIIKGYSGCCGLVNQDMYSACNVSLQGPCTNALFTANGAKATHLFYLNIFVNIIIVHSLLTIFAAGP